MSALGPTITQIKKYHENDIFVSEYRCKLKNCLRRMRVHSPGEGPFSGPVYLTFISQRWERLGNTLGRGLYPTYSPTIFMGTRILLHGLASAYFPSYPPRWHNAQRIPQPKTLNLVYPTYFPTGHCILWRNCPTYSHSFSPTYFLSYFLYYSPTFPSTYFPKHLFRTLISVPIPVSISYLISQPGITILISQPFICCSRPARK